MTQKNIESLNTIDRKILRILQREGRLPFSQLAKQVGLTTTPCIERVKRLERSGIIKGYTAILDAQLLDTNLVVYIQVRLDHTSSNNFEYFRNEVSKMPQILECHLVTGSFDFLLKVKVKSIMAYRQFLEEDLLSVPGVQASTSIVVMEVLKETLEIPV